MVTLTDLFGMITADFVGLIVAIFLIVYIGVWIWLFVDMLTSKNIKGTIKGIWFILFFAVPITPIVWLFVRKK